MITIENADKALKDYYLQAVSAQLNDNVSPFFTAIEKNTENVFGKDVNIAVVRGESSAVIACGESDDLPEPYSDRYLGITAPLKNIYGTIEVSDKALRASRDGSGAFVNLVNTEMEGLVSGAKFNFRRMLFGDGDGTLCNIVKAAEEGDGKVLEVDEAKSYFTGMTVDVISSDSTSSGHIVTAVDVAAKKVTLNGKPSVTVTGAKLAVSAAAGKELTGLKAIFGAEKLYGYTKAEEPFFAPYTKAIESALKEDDLCDVIDYMEENFNSKINMILCSFSTRKKIAALISENRRVVNTVDAAAGYGAVTVSGVPVYADRFCPEGTIYFLNTDDFVLCQLCDWEWLEDEDGKILKQVPGKAAYGATLVKYAELICKKPCGQAQITGA